jgi:hypothetical protein
MLRKRSQVHLHEGGVQKQKILHRQLVVLTRILQEARPTKPFMFFLTQSV